MRDLGPNCTGKSDLITPFTKNGERLKTPSPWRRLSERYSSLHRDFAGGCKTFYLIHRKRSPFSKEKAKSVINKLI